MQHLGLQVCWRVGESLPWNFKVSWCSRVFVLEHSRHHQAKLSFLEALSGKLSSDFSSRRPQLASLILYRCLNRYLYYFGGSLLYLIIVQEAPKPYSND